MSRFTDSSTDQAGQFDRHNVPKPRCIICNAEAVVSLRKDSRSNQACLLHLGEAETLLRVSEEFFAGPTF